MQPISYLDIPPLQNVTGKIRVPGSKSISNRALLLAALCEDQTLIKGLLDSDDTQVMLQALSQLGCKIEYLDEKKLAQGVRIQGLSKNLPRQQATSHQTQTYQEPVTLFLGNAGTVMRPLTAALALFGGHYQLTGVSRMYERPIGDLLAALRSFGAQIDCTGQEGYPPLLIRPPHLDVVQLAKPIQVKGNTSSQFLTALLMALPLVAQNDIHIEVVGELISKPYIAITLQLLASFGVQVRNEQFKRFIIPAGSRYTSPSTFDVESDASSASYFIAAGAIAATADAPLVIHGVGQNSIQGDIRFVEAVQEMGGSVTLKPNEIIVHRQTWPLKAIELDCNHIPDAAMTLAAMALYAQGTTRLTNIASWRVKETDRIDAMRNELTKLGATVITGPDFIEVSPPKVWQTAPIHTYDDHRIAMCLSLAAFNPCRLPIRLLDPACVNKTYPNYFDDFFAVTKTQNLHIPVITIDGPTASGKGTLASLLAQKLGYHYLDSGALYRVTAWAALQAGVSENDVETLAQLARELPVRFIGQQVWHKTDDVTDKIRVEQVGMMASKIAAYQPVRDALLHLQKSFQRLPGLVADGRDMGTVVFSKAPLKIFLTADAMSRAQRRHKQLREKGISAIIGDLHADLMARDAQDMNRAVAPLKPAPDAHLLDNSALSVDESINQVLLWWNALQSFQ